MKNSQDLTIADYAKALKSLPKITNAQKELLCAHCNLLSTTMEDLGDDTGLSTRGAASTYGRFARKIGLYLDNSPHRPNERHYWMEMICSRDKRDNQTIWIIRERFRKALERANIV